MLMLLTAKVRDAIIKDIPKTCEINSSHTSYQYWEGGGSIKIPEIQDPIQFK
jgi:hypothetical protein